jgi:hypothetical protein
MSERDDSRQHSTQPSRSHEEARELFPSYAVAMALGQATENRFQDVAAHVQNCPDCRAELDALLEVAVPAYRGQVAPADSYPQFNLAFLGMATTGTQESSSNWLIDSLRKLVVEFSEGLLASLQQPTYAQAARGPALYHYAPEPAPPGNLGLTIDVFADEHIADQGNIQVLLDVPSRDPFDQSGMRVNLRIGDQSWEGSTSTTGSVTFAAVPLKELARMRLEIALPEDSTSSQ